MTGDEAKRERHRRELSRRRHHRVGLDVEVEMRLEDPEGAEGAAIAGRLRNGGPDGARVDLDRELKPGQRLVILFPAAGVARRDPEVRCEIVWAAEAPEGEAWPAGVAFLDLDPKSRETLIEILAVLAARI